jgi:hypothetical protein
MLNGLPLFNWFHLSSRQAKIKFMSVVLKTSFLSPSLIVNCITKTDLLDSHLCPPLGMGVQIQKTSHGRARGD